jgi:hypothetical protein
VGELELVAEILERDRTEEFTNKEKTNRITKYCAPCSGVLYRLPVHRDRLRPCMTVLTVHNADHGLETERRPRIVNGTIKRQIITQQQRNRAKEKLLH